MPMSTALVSHIVGYNMTWSATIKTVEKSNFFLQLPLIWRRFWPQLVFFSVCVVRHRHRHTLLVKKSNPALKAMMGLTASNLLPAAWRVRDITVQFPLGMIIATHMLWPFALNPWFISFSVSDTE